MHNLQYTSIVHCTQFYVNSFFFVRSSLFVPHVKFRAFRKRTIIPHNCRFVHFAFFLFVVSGMIIKIVMLMDIKPLPNVKKNKA